MLLFFLHPSQLLCPFFLQILSKDKTKKWKKVGHQYSKFLIFIFISLILKFELASSYHDEANVLKIVFSENHSIVVFSLESVNVRYLFCQSQLGHAPGPKCCYVCWQASTSVNREAFQFVGLDPWLQLYQLPVFIDPASYHCLFYIICIDIY